jgi:hypothetical protein
MSYLFEMWHTQYALGAIAFTNETDNSSRVCMPKIAATTFSDNSFGCTGDHVLFERKNEGAEFRLIVKTGNGGVHQPQSDGKILVLPKLPPFVFTLPSTRQWKISSKKLQGKNTLARVITMEFDEAAGGSENDIRILTITVPVTKESDQACVFLFAVNWASKVVAANIAFLEFYAANHAGVVSNDGHGGL